VCLCVCVCVCVLGARGRFGACTVIWVKATDKSCLLSVSLSGFGRFGVG
jgi:hypothetical protein